MKKTRRVTPIVDYYCDYCGEVILYHRDKKTIHDYDICMKCFRKLPECLQFDTLLSQKILEAMFEDDWKINFQSTISAFNNGLPFIIFAIGKPEKIYGLEEKKFNVRFLPTYELAMSTALEFYDEWDGYDVYLGYKDKIYIVDFKISAQVKELKNRLQKYKPL